ncbi:MAG: glycosyltransferase [Armatimonadetes bacterium]|nr:glycosyltransferase [Armatimonadota bacterium]
MRVLFLAHLFPLPLDSGGKIKSYHTLRILSSAHDVYCISYLRDEVEAQRIGELRGLCEGIEVPLKRGIGRKMSDILGSITSGRSFIISRDYRRDMHRVVQDAIRRFKPDIIHIDHLQMAQFVDFDGSYKIVLDNHNVESMIIRRVAETSENALVRAYAGLEWPKLQNYELDVCRRSNLVLMVSEQDKISLHDLDSSILNVEAVPIGVDIDHFQPVVRTPGSKTILSIGTMHWPPNIDSMLYFYRDILPLVCDRVPDCSLTIAGQKPVDSIRALANDPRVTVIGYVDDDRKLSSECGAFIVPLRSGSGVRVKILNALAMGLPVVSTSIGAEGLAVKSGEHLMIADSPAEFAQAVIDVLQNPELAANLGSNGRKLVCEKYSWERVGERLLSLYAELAQ